MNNKRYHFRIRRLKPKYRKRFYLIIAVVIIFTLIIKIVHGYQNTKNTINKAYHADQATTLIKRQQPITILLLGIDTGADGRVDRGNSDTMMIATLNPHHKLLLESIPRDTLAQIIGLQPESLQKINSAYNIGSSKMAKKTVSKLLNIPINYYVTVNMGALEKIINDVGGITINSRFTIRDNNGHGKVLVHKGSVHLNGQQALVYARMRHQDPLGDYGRQQRQQQIIKALLPKLLTLRGLNNYQKILDSIANGMQTDLSFDDMVGLLRNYNYCHHITSDHLQGRTAMINGSSYQVIATKELQRVSDRIRKQLGLKSQSLNNAETRLNKVNSLFWNSENDVSYDTYGFVRIAY